MDIQVLLSYLWLLAIKSLIVGVINTPILYFFLTEISNLFSTLMKVHVLHKNLSAVFHEVCPIHNQIVMG